MKICTDLHFKYESVQYMIKREIQDKLLSLVSQYSVMSITGPRQSGKTTLSQTLFPEFLYINLERIKDRAFAMEKLMLTKLSLPKH